MLDLAKLTASPPDREPISHADMLDQLQDEMDAFVARCEAEERAEALDAVDAARAALRAATVRAARLTAEDGVFDEPAAPVKPKVDTPFMNVEQAAEYTGLSTGTIYNALYTGRLTKQPGTRRVVLRREDLQAFLGTKPPKKRRQKS